MKKREEYRTKKAQKELWLFLLTSLGIVALIVASWIAISSFSAKKKLATAGRQSMPGHTSDEQRYLGLMARIAQTNVLAGMVPVHIWKVENGATNFHCTGGLFTNTIGKNPFILTCGHAFWNIGSDRKPAYYFYQILQPRNPTLYPIASFSIVSDIAKDATNATLDVIKLIPGQLELITCMDHVEQFDGYNDLKVEYLSEDQEIIAQSTVTGERVRVAGAIKMVRDGKIAALLDYESWPGQSGTIFVGPDNNVYILSRILPIDQKMRKFYKDRIAPEHKTVTICSMVRLKY